MNTIARLLLVTIFASVAIGCDRHEPPANARSADDGARRQAQPAKAKGTLWVIRVQK